MREDLDLEKLRHELKVMRPNSPLLKVLVEELPKLNYRLQQAIVIVIIPSLLHTMKRWHSLYKVVKETLDKRGNWKEKARGNPKLGYKSGFGKNKED